MLRYTPKPWKIDPSIYTDGFAIIRSDAVGRDELSGVALVFKHPDQSGNAGLLRAAPDMYEALAEVTAHFLPKTKAQMAVYDKAIKALQLAKGEVE